MRDAKALLVLLGLVLLPVVAGAYEADVHFGLTRWLALRAGFTESQADAIAVGDQRVDGGQLESLELDLEYACAGRFPAVAKQAQRGHYPAVRAVPAPAAERVVEAGGKAARAELSEVSDAAKGKEGLMLALFGRALHPLQDSFAHAGTPAEPRLGTWGACDGTLASAHPASRGGPDSHAADLTARWPADALAMARATYEEMLRYGPVEGQARQPAAWAGLAPLVEAFNQAATKTQKRAWFVGQGWKDTAFLHGTSLPDGPDPGALAWAGRRFPPLPGTASMQHDAPPEVRTFFDLVLSRWLGAGKVEEMVAELGPGGGAAAEELSARLKLWKLRDHGAAAELAHAQAPLTAAQLKAVARLTRDPAASLAPATVVDALYPLQPSTPAPMPMLPYIVRALPEVGGAHRMIAIGRLKAAPYDTVGWIAEQRAGRWVLVGFVSSVDL